MNVFVVGTFLSFYAPEFYREISATMNQEALFSFGPEEAVTNNSN